MTQSNASLESSSAVPEVVNRAKSFWEIAAETRWGQYLTSIERDALLSAQSAFAEPGTGLEIGCEGGQWCGFLIRQGWTMLATDIDPRMLELCRERNNSVDCILVRPQDERSPVCDHSIDMLVCIEVPVVESSWFPIEARRVLKPGGILVGTFNNLYSWRGIAANAKFNSFGPQTLLSEDLCFLP